MKKTSLISFCLLAFLPAFSTPPGSPMSELQSQQLSLGVFYDHSGQQLFEEGSSSVLNTTGLGIEYGLADFIQVGGFAGAAELDVDVPPGRESDTTFHVFNSGLSLYGGGSAKLATPRFVRKTMRFVAYGQIGYIKAEDEVGNQKKGTVYNSGLAFQYEVKPRWNLVFGAEFFAIDGEQRSLGTGSTTPMGITSTSFTEYMRGLVGLEYTFKAPNKPFISIAFRPTGGLGYKDGFGLEGASVSVSLGAVSNFGKQSGNQQDEEDRPLSD